MKRTAIICIAVLLLAAAGSLFIYRSHLRVEAGIVADFSIHQLTTARLIGSEAELIVDDAKHQMVIASWITPIIKGNEKCPANMEAVYNNLKEKNINLLFRLDEKGILTHRTPEDKLKGVTGRDFSFREYFREVKRTGEPYISGMLLAGGEDYREVEGRFRTIFIVVPLYNNGKFAGVLGADLDFASMLEKSIGVRTAGIKGTGYCWAIDDRGIFVAHPIKEFVGRDAFSVRKERAPDISFEKINRIMREKMMKGKFGTDTYISGWHLGEKGRIKKLIAYAPFYLDGRQYSVAVVTPEREVVLLSRENFKDTLITMAFIIAAMLSGLLYILGLDRRRIEALKKETELAKEIKESRDYLQNLLETANDLVYTVDINGNFTYFNPRIEDYGYTPGELMGKRFLTILSEKHHGGRFEKSIREKVRQVYEVELKTKDGAIRICRISTSPLMDQNGGITGLIATVRDITEREQEKTEIIYLKEYSEKIVASIPSSLLVLDRDLNIKSVNRTYREIRGIGDDDVTGKNIREVFPGDLLEEGGLLQAFEEVVETGETRRLYGAKHVSSDHSEKILNITASGIRRAEEEEEEEEEDIILVIEDVTERARLVEEIRKAKNFMEAIFETTLDPVVTTDRRGTLAFVNRAATEALGYEKEELEGKHVSMFYDTGMERAKDIMKLLTEDRELRNYRMKLLTREKRKIPISLSGSLLRDSRGEVTGTLGFLRDITDLVQTEEDIRKKNKELESFVYTISHDLRAPVVSIQGFSSILLSDFQDKLDDTGKRYLARIQANVRQMEILINDLLEFSRIGRIAGAFEDVPATEIIRDVLDVLGPQLKKRGIKVNVQSGLPVIHCEKTRIYQVFDNLIQNSIKYMGSAENPVIEIGCRKTDGFHEFYVKDNGIGIDPQYHQKIFQIFQRLKEVDAKGTGIGLAIVERIAEIHGGSVRVESERGKGATFWFTVGTG
jgi:PAS domain S-box-containing protein